jgi:hypothetical protein
MTRVIIAGAFTILAASGVLLAAQQQEREAVNRQAEASVAKPGPAPSPASDQPAWETRGELYRLLTQYPPSLPQVLRLDHSLLTNESYLAAYPALAGFLAQHPEVLHNPAFFVGTEESQWPGTPRTQAIRLIGDVLAGLGVFLIFTLVLSLTAWGIKTFVEHRRWLRLSKIQTDTHSKLLDRLTSNEDLLAYIQTPAGRQFLEAAPVSVGPRPFPIGAPINRILWSAQAGVILILVGAGLWYARAQVIEEAAQVLSVLGVLGMFLGAGFVISAGVAFGISRALGLFETPELRPHA